jgi:hypothetical protein
MIVHIPKQSSLVNQAELARIWGVSYNRIYYMRMKQGLPYLTDGHHIFFDLNEANNWRIPRMELYRMVHLPAKQHPSTDNQA